MTTKKSSTCLAVLKDQDDNLWFAGDRRVSFEFQCQEAPDPKVRLKNGILIAEAGLSILSDLVITQFDIPKKSKKQTPTEYIYQLFIPLLISWLQDEMWVAVGSRAIKSELLSEEDISAENVGVILLGVDDELFELNLSTTAIAAVKVNTPYTAGCGGPVALGALLAMHPKVDIERRLLKALQITASVCHQCDDNVDIVTNKRG